MIYISGNIVGSYRAQNIIKCLMDNHIKYVYLPHNIIKVKWMQKCATLFFMVLFFPIRIILILICTKVIVLPMCFNYNTLIDAFIAKVFRKKIFLEYYISDYDTLVYDRKSVKLGSKKAFFIQLREKLITRFSTVIVCLSQAEKQYYLQYMDKKAEEKIVIIPLVIDRIEPKKNLTNSEMRPFTICWWGTYIPLHGLDKIIRSFSHLKNENVKLYIFGDSEAKSNEYRQIVDEEGLQELVIFENGYTFKNGLLPKFLREHCDLALGNFGTSRKAKIVIVNKVIDASVLKIPSLTMKTKVTEEYYTDEVDIYFVDVNATSLEVAKKIIYIMNSTERPIVARNSYKLYNERFSPEVFSSKYIEILK